MWRALPTCPRSASPPASRLLSWSGRRALSKTTLSTAFAKALGLASTVVSPPAASENPAYPQGSDRQYRQSDLGTAALRRLQPIDWNVEQVVNSALAVESDVWPKPIGENGQRALSLMVMRILDLHRAVQEARRAIDEMQGRREETKER